MEIDGFSYKQENQKEHVEIGRVYYQDSENEQLYIANLELFGNGIEITIYVDNEPQNIQRGVVRNTSYEFLQYTDDGEMVIVRVNTMLFVMTKQQFELVKMYYDLLKSNKMTEEKGQPLNITSTDFSYLVKQLTLKMGFTIVNSKGRSDYIVFKCLRDKEEFGIGCLIGNRKILNSDIELLHEIALRNFLIFSYYDYEISKYRDDYGREIDIISGKEFVRMIKDYLKVDIA